MLDATNPDAAAEVAGSEDPDAPQLAAARESLYKRATRPFDNPLLRQKIASIQKRNEQVIDVVSVDRVLTAQFSEADTERARAIVESFRQFIEDNRDEIAALQLIFNAPRRGVQLNALTPNAPTANTPTFEQIKELADRLSQPPYIWTTEVLWLAYAQLEKDKVRGLSARRVLTDVVSLVRHAV